MDSTSATEDNLKNLRDETAKHALDKLMATEEQSYEEFVKGFTFFTEGQGARKMTATHSKPSLPAQKGQSNKAFQIKSITVDKEVTKLNAAVSKEADFMEEVVLDEGMLSSRINAIQSVRTGTAVKFDNFVWEGDEETAAEVEDLTADPGEGGYTASFLAAKHINRISGGALSQQQNPWVQSGSSSREPDASSVTGDITELLNDLSVEESQTDTLLLNFLADLQNELNENQSINRAMSGNSEDIQTFLARNKAEEKLVKQELGTMDEEDVNFSDEESEDVLKLCSDSTDKHVKIVIDSSELSKDNKDTHTKSEIYKSVLMDSEGNMMVGRDAETNPAGTVENHLQEGPVVFPGEVQGEAGMKDEESTNAINERLLDFKAIYAQARQDSTHQVSSEGTETEVATTLIEAFHLDETFDYDNVILVPKFSMIEVDQLRGVQTEQPTN